MQKTFMHQCSRKEVLFFLIALLLKFTFPDCMLKLLLTFLPLIHIEAVGAAGNAAVVINYRGRIPHCEEGDFGFAAVMFCFG